MHAKLGAMSIGLALCLTVGASLGASAVQWQPTLERAQVVAAHSNRLVLVHFWGNGCPPCAWMEREVFSRQDVASAIDQGFVAVRINKDQLPNVARQFGVAAVPTDVIITPQGQVLGSYVGKTSAAEFVGRLTQVAQRVAPQNYASQPGGNGGQPLGPPAGYAQQAPVQQSPYPGQGQGMGGPVSGVSQPGFPNSQQPPGYALPAQATPRYSDQFGPASNGSPAAAAAPNPGQYGMNAPQDSGPAIAADPYASYGGNAYPPNPQMGAVAQMPPQPSQQVAAQPAEGNPPLALDGFCPVSLERTMRLDPEPKWIPGDPSWGLRHEGRTYLFAGPEEQQAFFNNPNYYAPVLSGNDIVLQVEQGRQVPGSREFGARWRDRVYLFSSRESYDKFQANPAFYENEVLGPQQASQRAQMPGQQNMTMQQPMVGRQNMPMQQPMTGQQNGTAMNPSYGYR